MLAWVICVACFRCVGFTFFSTTWPRDWLGRTSPIWPTLCRVGRKTLINYVWRVVRSGKWSMVIFVNIRNSVELKSAMTSSFCFAHSCFWWTFITGPPSGPVLFCSLVYVVCRRRLSSSVTLLAVRCYYDVHDWTVDQFLSMECTFFSVKCIIICRNNKLQPLTATLLTFFAL